MQLDPNQAQALFEAGSFVLISGLPSGTEVSIDTDAHYATQSFSGWKMIPPGLHLLTYSTPASQSADHSAALSTGLSLRRGIIRTLRPKQTVVLKYSEGREELESAVVDEHGVEVESVVGKDHLMTMDKNLAPYPFQQLDAWKALTNQISESDVKRILGSAGKVDGLMEAEGEEVIAPATMRTPGLTNMNGSDKETPPATRHPGITSPKEESSSITVPRASGTQTSSASDDEPPADDRIDTLQFCALDLKRSWRTGATGEEVTRFSRDKSWIFVDRLMHGFQGNTKRLLAEVQISFLLFLRLYNFSALTAHKKLLSLVSRSAISLLSGNFASTLVAYFPASSSTAIRKAVDQDEMTTFYAEFVSVLRVQVCALPDDAFSKDLEGIGLEEYWIKELDELYRGVAAAVSFSTGSSGGFSFVDFKPVLLALEALRQVGKSKFGWDLIDVDEYNRIMRDQEAFEEETGYLEEGEDAPVVVEE